MHLRRQAESSFHLVAYHRYYCEDDNAASNARRRGGTARRAAVVPMAAVLDANGCISEGRPHLSI
jgi:hypothetical protein